MEWNLWNDHIADWHLAKHSWNGFLFHWFSMFESDSHASLMLNCTTYIVCIHFNLEQRWLMCLKLKNYTRLCLMCEDGSTKYSFQCHGPHYFVYSLHFWSPCFLIPHQNCNISLKKRGDYLISNNSYVSKSANFDIKMKKTNTGTYSSSKYYFFFPVR